MDPFIAEIKMFGGNFAPRGWAFCNGQLLPISQYTALFSLLGTTYGGNGQTTFGLPDLRGRVPVHAGQGPGLSPYTLGEMSGSENVTLLSTQMPAHTHAVTVGASSNAGDTNAPSTLAAPQDADRNPINIYNAGPANAAVAGATAAPAGGNQPHENRQPFCCVNFIIALEGIFPSRS